MNVDLLHAFFEVGYSFLIILLRTFLATCIIVLPGSWLTFGLALDGLSFKVKLLLGATLSPAVLAFQFFVIKLFGLDFAYVALALFVINLPAFLLFAKQAIPLHRLHFSNTLKFGSLLFFVIAGIVSLPWILVPNYRPFAWHALMHTDMVYAITRSISFFPEEPEMAGLILSYTWTGDIFWSILGWLSNWSPTSSYPFINLIWLLIAFLLAYELAREGFELPNSTALLSVGLLFTGTGAVGTIAWLIAGDRNRWNWIFGSIQLTAFLNKYRGFEVILFAFALLIGLALVATTAMRRKIRFVEILISCLLTALGLLYPILFPMGCLIVGGFVLALLTRWPQGLPNYERGDLVRTIICFGISIVLFIAILQLTTQDRTDMPFQFSQAGRQAKTLQTISELLLFLIPSAPLVVMSFLRRHGPTMLLALTTFGMMILYIFTSVYGLEYKFILAATIALAPLAAAGMEPIMARLSRARWLVAVLVPLILGGLNLMFLFQFYKIDPWGGLIPPNLKNAPYIVEDAFWIELSPLEENANWIKAVQELTPEDTILVARDSHIHLGPFVNRSLYFPSDLDGQATTGYSVDNQLYMLEQRGYPEAVWQKRYEIVRALYGSDEPTRLINVFSDLQSLNRPLAILFSSRAAPALDWLRREKLGFQLHADEKYIVWFIDGPAFIAMENR